MNYEPNTTHWWKGDVVIHDADAKEPKMLMRVIGYTRKDGLCKTQYIDTSRRRTIWKNDLKYLHDPARFELKESMKQTDWEAVRRWNVRYPVGQAVNVKLDSGEIRRTVTRTKAQFVGLEPNIWLEGVSGCYLLYAVWTDEMQPPKWVNNAYPDYREPNRVDFVERVQG